MKNFTVKKLPSLERLWEFIDSHFIFVAILPAVIIFLLFTIYPAIELVLMSGSSITFENAELIREPALEKNIVKFLDDWIFRKALVNTLIFVLLSTSIEMLFGFGLALAVNELVRGRGIVRTTMLLPILIPPVAIGSIWRLMYNSEFGVINAFLELFGIPAQQFLGSTSTALLSVVVVDIWHWTPLVFLILLAGLEALPEEVMEASSIDGATYNQKLRFIIIPLMWPALIVAFMFRSIVAFKVFDQIFLLTSGGPGTSTEVISLYVYKVFFQQNQLGYGALLALITIGIICSYLAVFAIAQRKFTGAK
ncbi:MAG: sugar ABC transporter permease [Rhizobiales bacterium]|nr:sugar ABC transporter permease [Hyphomicrobiales bacterium]